MSAIAELTPTPATLSAELIAELKQEWPDRGRVRELVLRDYSQNTGIPISAGGPSEREFDLVVIWMTRQSESFGAFLLKRRGSLLPSYSSRLSSKIAHLVDDVIHCAESGSVVPF